MRPKDILPRGVDVTWAKIQKGLEFRDELTYYFFLAQSGARPKDPRLEVAVAVTTVNMARWLIAHYPKSLARYDFNAETLDPKADLSVNVVFTADPNYRGAGSGGLGSAKAFWVGYTDPAFRRLYRYRDGTWFYQGYWVDGVGTLAHELHHAWGGHHEFQGEFFTPLVWGLVHSQFGWKLVPSQWRKDLWWGLESRSRIKGYKRTGKQALKLLEKYTGERRI